MSEGTMTFSATFAAALLEWDERLFKMYQARHHAKWIIQPLKDANMKICAKNAAKIYQDIDLQMRTGTLLIRMQSMFLEEYTLTMVELEQWRQFTQTALVWNELTEEEARTEYGVRTLAVHEAFTSAAKRALSMEEASA